ncbi:hypothetical protein CA51_10750 [Rosistilla oblonga]|uniref:Uncharacterized protein n=1 Tax=Rosistilla oblonga TaxID=2527990 RepID=A0A518IPX0_9BACT|nr:hypothetical protein [Rosistilla oblonga]QDV11214.1 hypothetical protein CA51_10750 [Rosistilla oblonga]QDV55141.1 hypothetical protein Mal33_11100 [Rosistilla oblonga]
MSHRVEATHAASLQNSHRARQLLAAWFVGLIAAVALGAIASPAWGQAAAGKPQYDVMKYQPNWFTEKSIVNRIKQIRSQIVSDPAQLSEQKDFFVKIYQNIFASMTDPAEFANLQPRRAEVMKDIYNAARRGNTQVSRGLSIMSFQQCKAIAQGNYYPGARINAVFMIGELNDREPNSLEKKAPIPMQAALPLLLEIVEDAKYDDGLRVAAIQGIQRHASLNAERWKPELQDKVADLMIATAQESAPKDRNLEAHGWVQMLAINTLVSLKNPRRVDQVAKLVMELPTKEDSSQMALVYAARATPKIEIPKEFKPQADAVLKSWATQIVGSIAREAKRIEDLEKPRPKASMMGMGSGEMGMMSGPEGYDMGGMEMGMEMGMGMGMPGATAAKPQTVEIILARRMLNDVIESFHLGLTGTRAKTDPARVSKGLVANLSDEKEKADAVRLVALIDEVKEGVNDTMISKNLEYAEKLRELEAKLQAFVNPDAAADPKPGNNASPFFDGPFSSAPPALNRTEPNVASRPKAAGQN